MERIIHSLLNSIFHALFEYTVLSSSRCVTSMVYYGLSFNAGKLAGNFYLNFAASGLVEIPAYLLATILVER